MKKPAKAEIIARLRQILAELEAAPLDRAAVKPLPPGERSGIVLRGRGDGLTTRIFDAMTGEDLSARYGIRDVTLKVAADNWDGVSLVVEFCCPVVADLSGCWPGDLIK